MSNFINTWHPELVSHLAEIDKLPVETLEERISKADENIRGLAALKGVWKGR